MSNNNYLEVIGMVVLEKIINDFKLLNFLIFSTIIGLVYFMMK